MKIKALLLAVLLLPLLNAQEPLVEGNASSSVRVVIYEDLQCRDCAQFRMMVDQYLIPRYGGDVAFEHRDFPIPRHTWSRQAAVAARFFQERNERAALDFRRHVLSNLQSITPDSLKEVISRFARENRLEPSDALAALDDEQYKALVENDFQEGLKRGVRKTPTVFINGDPLVERFTLRAVMEKIEQQLAMALSRGGVGTEDGFLH